MNAFWIAIGVVVGLLLLLVWIGAAFSSRPRKPDYVDPEDRPLYGPNGDGPH